MFYRNLLKVWFSTNVSQNIDQVQNWENQVIWSYVCITTGGKTLYFKEWIKRGIILLSEICKTYFLCVCICMRFILLVYVIVIGGKSPIGILNKVGPFQEILKIVTNLFIFDRSCQKIITLLVSYKR